MRLLALMMVVVGLYAQVTSDRIRQSQDYPQNWLTYSGNYGSWRYSKLDQIHTGSVKNLGLKWVYQMKTLEKVETTPLVVDGVMYFTEPPNAAHAVDAETGRRYWSYHRPLPDKINVCCGAVNRGMAILGDALFVGTNDGFLVALDRKTGNVLWETGLGDRKTGHSVTMAPLVVKDKVIVGIAGGEYGIRGFLDAYDPRTGKRLWRFWTVPGPGEKGNDSWSGDSWKRGGAPTWITGSYDPSTNLVYWGTGNPSPDWNGDVRKGDNLYSSSVVAIDADTGLLKWHFQFTPHDLHDWDSTQVPVLVDAVFRGRERKLMFWANRNAFFYVLDRETGEFLSGKPFVKQTWAEGLDDKGRPIRRPNTAPSREGTLVYPGVQGGTNWYSPSYSPLTRLFYMSVWDYASLYYTGDADYHAGNRFLGSAPVGVTNDPGRGIVKALDPLTSETKWEFPLQTTPQSGILSTAGGIVFGGNNEGQFFALDAETGKELWRANTGGVIAAGPVTYSVKGKQLVTIASGSALFTFGF
jgi:alcohol dehydrogenase (cytochrome c)